MGAVVVREFLHGHHIVHTVTTTNCANAETTVLTLKTTTPLALAVTVLVEPTFL
jgi:hypothetical protein